MASVCVDGMLGSLDNIRIAVSHHSHFGHNMPYSRTREGCAWQQISVHIWLSHWEKSFTILLMKLKRSECVTNWTIFISTDVGKTGHEICRF